MESNSTSNSHVEDIPGHAESEDTMRQIANMQERLAQYKKDGPEIEWSSPPRQQVSGLDSLPIPAHSPLSEAANLDLDIAGRIHHENSHGLDSDADLRPPPGHQPSRKSTPLQSPEFDLTPFVSPSEIRYDPDGCGQPRDKDGFYCHMPPLSPGRLKELEALQSSSLPGSPLSRRAPPAAVPRTSSNGFERRRSPIDDVYSDPDKGVLVPDTPRKSDNHRLSMDDDEAGLDQTSIRGVQRPPFDSPQRSVSGRRRIDPASQSSNPYDRYREHYEPNVDPPPTPPNRMILRDFLRRIDGDRGTDYLRAIEYFEANRITMENIDDTDFDDHPDCPLEPEEIDSIMDMHYGYARGRSDGHLGL